MKRKEISTNDKLRHLILGNRAGLQASKPRDGKEKAVSAKRGLEEESSDEDQGRSALGKAKKSKNGNSQNTMNSLIKDGAKIEHKQEVKSTSQENFFQKPSHVFRPEVKSQVKLDKRTEISQEESTSQKAKIQAAGKKKPLVDYGSDDESDYHGSEPSNMFRRKSRAAHQMSQLSQALLRRQQLTYAKTLGITADLMPPRSPSLPRRSPLMLFLASKT